MQQSTDPTPRRVGKYSGYSLAVGNDIERQPWYEDRGPDVLKVHARVFRIPSKREFALRHFSTSTDEERTEGERVLALSPRLFEVWEADGRARRRRHPAGYYFWTAPIGSFLDDPLKRLQLEHSIDLSSEVSA